MAYKLRGLILAVALIAGSIVVATPPAQAYPTIVTVDSIGCRTRVAIGKYGASWMYSQEGWLCGPWGFSVY